MIWYELGDIKPLIGDHSVIHICSFPMDNCSAVWLELFEVVE